MSQHVIDDILTFWFGPKSEPITFRDAWFVKNPAFDADIAARFSGAMQDAAAGTLGDLMQSSRGALALVLLLDQFPRNVYRGTAQAFARDAQARVVAHHAIDQGLDQELDPIERMFLYLPFEHSENLADQQRSLDLFKDLGLEGPLDYAQQHYDIIEKYGRFPHRNAILGRTNTPEEDAYLAEPGAGF